MLREKEQQIGGHCGFAAGLAALEFAAGLIGRSLAMAETSGNSIAASVITPAFLQSVGRALVRRGEIVYGIEVAGGKIQLSTASFWDIEGNPQPNRSRDCHQIRNGDPAIF